MVLETVQGKAKFITLHLGGLKSGSRNGAGCQRGSRRISWYSGSLPVLRRILSDGLTSLLTSYD
jgi:hypothetical protein